MAIFSSDILRVHARRIQAARLRNPECVRQEQQPLKEAGGGGAPSREESQR